MDDQVVINFLTELTKLTEVFGIVIGGCGCCGSPYLKPRNETDGKLYSVCDDYSALLLGTAEENDGRELRARDEQA